jgi:chromosome segregation ATPase
MDLSNGSGGIDSSKLIDYLSTQFLKDLGQMAALRDELAKRQGAISAVDDANRLRTEAEIYAQARKIEADDNLTSAKNVNDKAKELKKTLDAREIELNARQGQYEKDAAALEKAVQAHKKAVADAEVSLQTAQNALKQTQSKLTADQAALDARIAAFQAKIEKVASISV